RPTESVEGEGSLYVKLGPPTRRIDELGFFGDDHPRAHPAPGGLWRARHGDVPSPNLIPRIGELAQECRSSHRTGRCRDPAIRVRRVPLDEIVDAMAVRLETGQERGPPCPRG